MTVELTDAEFADALASFEHTAFRLELQPYYNEPYEVEGLVRWLAGERQIPTEDPGNRGWFEQSRRQAAEGKVMSRVRVHEDPPTDYQQWMRWYSRWNVEAGEDIRYLTRTEAEDIGLLPAAGDQDWWLFDDRWLLVMTFDADRRRISNVRVEDPQRVEQAQEWRDLALRYARALEYHD